MAFIVILSCLPAALGERAKISHRERSSTVTPP
jgi:hypothetical protein